MSCRCRLCDGSPRRGLGKDIMNMVDQHEKELMSNKDFLTCDKMVKILVSPSKRAFHVHEQVLCTESSYFRAAFQGSFREAETKSLELEHDDPETFQNVLRWIYGQASAISMQLMWDFSANVKLYVLADKLGAEKLKALALYRVESFISKPLPSTRDIELVYEETSEDSPLRWYIIHIAVQEVFRYDQDVVVDADAPKNRDFDASWWTEILNCNMGFAKDVWSLIRNHSGLKSLEKGCGFHYCRIHWHVPKAKTRYQGGIKVPCELNPVRPLGSTEAECRRVPGDRRENVATPDQAAQAYLQSQYPFFASESDFKTYQELCRKNAPSAR